MSLTDFKAKMNKSKGENFALFAWFGEPCKEHSYGKVKGKGIIFLTGHIQCKQSLSPRSLELSTKPGEEGEILALYRPKSLSLDYEAKLKSPRFFL
jgi:hypothetical protein